MGEEYGEDTPFLYFVSHSDRDLIEAVRKGRKEEFKAFAWDSEPPDPQSVDTFLKSKIIWEKKENSNHKVLLSFYKHIIRMRKETPALSHLDKDSLDACEFEKEKIVWLRRWKDDSHIICFFNFNSADMKFISPLPEGYWEKMIDSSDVIWKGPGSLLPEKISAGEEITLRGHSFTLYNRLMIL
jgi:maltooligosyltrehalose trehalohydrolase